MKKNYSVSNSLFFFFSFSFFISFIHCDQTVIATWPFTEAVKVAYQTLEAGRSRLDSVEIGCSKCEELQWYSK